MKFSWSKVKRKTVCLNATDSNNWTRDMLCLSRKKTAKDTKLCIIVLKPQVSNKNSGKCKYAKEMNSLRNRLCRGLFII